MLKMMDDLPQVLVFSNMQATDSASVDKGNGPVMRLSIALI